MAEMDSLFPVHLNVHSSLHSHHFHLRPMLATQDALDTYGGYLLESKYNQPSRRSAFKCVSSPERF